MVRWYNPLLLLRSGIRSVTTTTIGGVIDYREIQSSLDPVGPDNGFGTYDYRADGAATQMWIDYVADLGDGWDATYAVAQALAADTLKVDGGAAPRGDILIMGGDQVYPDPSDDAYKERTINPYRTACGAVSPFKADLFALPGNHDWYDGLHDFKDLFLQFRAALPAGRWIPFRLLGDPAVPQLFRPPATARLVAVRYRHSAQSSAQCRAARVFSNRFRRADAAGR